MTTTTESVRRGPRMCVLPAPEQRLGQPETATAVLGGPGAGPPSLEFALLLSHSNSRHPSFGPGRVSVGPCCRSENPPRTKFDARLRSLQSIGPTQS